MAGTISSLGAALSNLLAVRLGHSICVNQKTGSIVLKGSEFYMSKNNLAAVRWTTKKQIISVAKHEIPHLTIGNLFDNLSTRFNEDFEKFMEHL